MIPLLEIKNLSVSVEGKSILENLCLKIMPGEVHALLGRNGSGKTTLAYTLMGHPKYEVTSGELVLNGEKINALTADERAKRRMFLAFQYPVGVPGVSVGNFLRASVRAVRGSEIPVKEIRPLIKKELVNLEIPDGFLSRSLGDGFSGGERKRLETLQMRLLQPKFAILDETDSGLDVDAFRSVAETIRKMQAVDRSLLLITHYHKMLEVIKPDHVHILVKGKIVRSGGNELAETINQKGFDGVLN